MLKNYSFIFQYLEHEKMSLFMCCASCLACVYGLGHYGPRYQITQQNIVSSNLVKFPPFLIAFIAYILKILSFSSDVSIRLDTSPTPRELVSDSIKRSTVAHLFHFYPVLCEIASIPRRSPTAWVQTSTSDSDKVNRGKKNERDDGKAKGKLQKKENSSNNNKEKSNRAVADAVVSADGDVKGDVIELDARTLARDCLKELGREMGVSR
jgi:hypothetical protein